MKAILFDLDGTLLPMDQDEFIRTYFGGIQEVLATIGDVKSLMQAFGVATKAMIQNEGALTSEEKFIQVFEQSTGLNFRELEPRFIEFYKTKFQLCQKACPQNPASREIIKTLKEKGFRLILATNPMFPRIATLSRLAWAGLDADDFEEITTYENYHHCKPNLDYYREIFEKLQLQAEDCMMIGNDVNEDMQVAELGVQTYLVDDCLLNRHDLEIKSTYRSDLNGLLAWVKALD